MHRANGWFLKWLVPRAMWQNTSHTWICSSRGIWAGRQMASVSCTERLSSPRTALLSVLSVLACAEERLQQRPPVSVRPPLFNMLRPFLQAHSLGLLLWSKYFYWRILLIQQGKRRVQWNIRSLRNKELRQYLFVDYMITHVESSKEPTKTC